jgi:uncharacterized protein (TIGR02466 family)
MIKIEVIPFLGYPIARVNLDTFVDRDTIKFIKDLSYIKHSESGLKFSKDAHILQNKKLKELKYVISSAFNKYVDNVLEVENQFYMCNSWCTFQKANDFHPAHVHPNAIFSSVYYFETDNTNLQFECSKSKIQEGFSFEYKIKNFNYFNSAKWSLPVKQGDLLIFPGELRHKTFPYNGKNERIVIGSSYFIEGEIGLDANYNSINIGNKHIRY